jgi:prefoldin alpha subunit
MGDKPSAKKEEELRSMLAQLEGGKARLDALGKQIQLIEASLSEVNATEASISAIENAKAGTEILVPLGSDSYVKATLADTKTLLVGVGSRLSLEKSVPEAKKTLEQRRTELENAMKKLQESYIELSGRLSELNAVVEDAVAELQQK